MKSEYTIVYDDREKRPLLFPQHIITLADGCQPSKSAHKTVRIKWQKKRIYKGDYYLSGSSDRIVIERKGSLNEIAVNCLHGRRRRLFVEELDFLRERCRWPVLLLEGSPRSLLQPTPEVPHPGVPVAALIRLLLERGIMLQLLSSDTLSARRATGEWTAHLLISGAITNRIP